MIDHVASDVTFVQVCATPPFHGQNVRHVAETSWSNSRLRRRFMVLGAGKAEILSFRIH